MAIFASAIKKHPRICGEDRRFTSLTALSRETPPHMRGRLTHQIDLAVSKGNTPAYAGKTSDALLSSAFGEKHPRIDGEDFHINMFKLSA